MTDSEILERVASRAKQRRISLQMQQKDLARKSGVSLSAVRTFEQTGKIAFDKLVRLGRVLQILDGILAIVPQEEPSDISDLIRTKPKRQRVR